MKDISHLSFKHHFEYTGRYKPTYQGTSYVRNDGNPLTEEDIEAIKENTRELNPNDPWVQHAYAAGGK